MVCAGVRRQRYQFHTASGEYGLQRKEGDSSRPAFSDGARFGGEACPLHAGFDVVLDVRPQSPSYGKWYGAELSAENACMLFVPEHCAHGYQTLEDDTEMFYMASQYYAPNAARGVRFDDPAFGIQWPLPPAVLSDQDRNWPLFQRA
jgi:hypothetical protein